MKRSVRLAFLVAISAALLTSCGRDSNLGHPRSPSSPIDEVATLPSHAFVQAETMVGVAILGEWVTIIQAGTDLEAFALENDLAVLDTDVLPNGDLLVLFEGDEEMVDFPPEDAVIEVQQNEYAVLSSPVDYTLGFFQGDWGGDDILAQSGLEELKLPTAQLHSKGGGVTVAVLDTGADIEHPFLIEKVKVLPPGGSFQSIETQNGLDDDGDGEIDEAFGHGTHVAGSIAMCAPEAAIIPIRVLNDDGIGTAFDLAAGMLVAQREGAQIVNLSLVLSAESRVVAGILRQLAEDGIAIICAAGNDPDESYFPATDPNTISVAATQIGSVLASFSSAWIDCDIGAPGVGIESSYPGGGSAIGSGSSMACGIFSGLAAQLTAVEPQQRPIVAVKHILQTGLPMTPRAATSHGRAAPIPALKLAKQEEQRRRASLPGIAEHDPDY